MFKLKDQHRDTRHGGSWNAPLNGSALEPLYVLSLSGYSRIQPTYTGTSPSRLWRSTITKLLNHSSCMLCERNTLLVEYTGLREFTLDR